MQSPQDPVNHLLPGRLVLQAGKTGQGASIPYFWGLEAQAAAPSLAREFLGSPGGEQVEANEAIREEFERVREPRE